MIHFTRTRILRGFTLIEILIALVIFALIAVVMTSVLITVFKTRDRLLQHSNRLEEWQIAVMRMGRDISQMLAPFPPDPAAIVIDEPTLSGDSQTCRFTTTGFVNPGEWFPRSHLQKIIYTFTNHRLERLSELSSPTTKQIIWEHLLTLTFLYITPGGATVSKWPPPNSNETLANSLPAAIQIEGQMQDGCTFSYLIPIASTTLQRKKNT